MITEEQKAKVSKLKGQIAAAGPHGTSREVREAVVILKKELKLAGMTARALAGALDVHETTLCRWECEAAGRASGRSRAEASGFRKVRIKTARPAPPLVGSMAPPAQWTSRGVQVTHVATGLVVDGLDVETLAALLRKLT